MDNNYLEIINFKTIIKRLPDVEFLSKNVILPSVSVASVDTPNQLLSLKNHGDHMIFAPLDITFFIDSQMNNYQKIFNWMKAYSTPNKSSEYNNPNLVDGDNLKSDLSVLVYTSKNNPQKKFTFKDVFPTDLSSINISVNNDSVSYGEATATFMYNTFEIENI